MSPLPGKQVTLQESTIRSYDKPRDTEVWGPKELLEIS